MSITTQWWPEQKPLDQIRKFFIVSRFVVDGDDSDQWSWWIRLKDTGKEKHWYRVNDFKPLPPSLCKYIKEAKASPDIQEPVPSSSEEEIEDTID